MPYDEDLAERIRELLARRKDITEKKLFGGIGFFLHGNLFVGVLNDTLVARVGADGYDDALEEPYARPFDFTGKPMSGWVLVDLPGVEDDLLAAWVDRCLAFVKTLPAKA